MATTEADKAETLAEFFSSVFTKEDCTHIPRLQVALDEPLLIDIDVTEALVESKLKNLRPTSSPGPDRIHPHVLRELTAPLSGPLCALFRKSLDSGDIPQDWKEGEITPIFKKGDRHDPSNYRPVSLTSVLSKLLEAVVRDRIMEYMSDRGLISDAQHGFRPRRSCATQLLASLEAWTQRIEEGDPVDVSYLDFQKAFDTVPHLRLLQKLHDLGIRGPILTWVKSFLTGRRQRVVLSGEQSRWTSVDSGIPQGSVLGPTLFVLFVNDIPECVTSGIMLFADDAKLFVASRMQAERSQLQADLDALGEWSRTWQLNFNLKKCKTLHLGSANPNQEHSLQMEMLDSVPEEKDLGVIIDQNLKFREQAASSALKGNRILGLIRRSFANLDRRMLPLLYKSMVRPLLEYGNVIWGPFNKHDQKPIEKVQRRATRLIPELRHRPYEERLQALRLPSLQHRRRRGDMIVMHQLLHDRLGLRKEDFVAQPPLSTTRSNTMKVAKPRAHTRARRNHLPVRAVTDWNSLPEAVVRSSSTNEFKGQLDKHWLANQFDLP